MRIKLSSILERRTLLTVPVAGLFVAVTLGGQNAAVVAHDAWARVPAPSKLDTAAYMVIENHSAQPRAVVAVSSSAADKVEMHQMKMMAGKADDKGSGMPGMAKKEPSMMVMTPVAQIPIPANGKATLEPNGLHIMMFGLKSKLADGDIVTLTLKLDDGTTVPVAATVHK